MTPWRARRTISLSVRITMPSPAAMAQEATGLGARSISTRHMRQLAGTDSRSWKQKRGTSMPSCSHACRIEVPGSTSISMPSMVSFGILS